MGRAEQHVNCCSAARVTNRSRTPAPPVPLPHVPPSPGANTRSKILLPDRRVSGSAGALVEAIHQNIPCGIGDAIVLPNSKADIYGRDFIVAPTLNISIAPEGNGDPATVLMLPSAWMRKFTKKPGEQRPPGKTQTNEGPTG
jgi:hypothetical protein